LHFTLANFFIFFLHALVDHYVVAIRASVVAAAYRKAVGAVTNVPGCFMAFPAAIRAFPHDSSISSMSS